MKLLILGHARHGKDTVLELLRADHGFQYRPATSIICEQIVYPVLAPLYPGGPVQCEADKDGHRQTWFDLVRAHLATHGQDWLVRETLKHGDLFAGTRSRSEYEATRHLFDFILWVERKGYPEEPSTSMELERRDAHFTIYNDAGLANLRSGVDAAVSWCNTALRYRKGIE